MTRKKPEIEYCGDCDQRMVTSRSGIFGKIEDHWCTGLQGPFREGIESLGRHPGHCGTQSKDPKREPFIHLKQLELFQ